MASIQITAGDDEMIAEIARAFPSMHVAILDPVRPDIADAGLSWLFVDWLWIRDDRRGQGIGGRLLAAAEAEARARGCGGIYLGSFTFQAPDYYKRAGYSEFGRIDGFPPGHALVFLLKRL